jgi:TonB family protein
MMRECQICLLVLFVMACSAVGLAQSQTDADRAAQAAVKAVRSRDIPEASLPCTADEAKWWNDLRMAGKAINPARAGKSETENLMKLIKEGVEKSYQIPVPDHYAIVLWRAVPQYTEEARNKKINGSVALAVELLPDGTVGEVKVAQGLDPGLDKIAVETARKLIFLPAIKNRKFVPVWSPMTMSFNIY